MQRTLFYLPEKIGDIPLFGFGILLVAWAIGSVALIVWLVRRQGWTNDTRGYMPVLAVMGGAIAYLIPLIVETGRGLPIHGYGTMVLLGVAAGIWLAVVRAKRAGLDPEIIFSLAFWMFLAGIVGARIFYVIEYWDTQFHKETLIQTLAAIANIPQGGLVIFGCFIGGCLAFLVFTRRHFLPILATYDLIAPSMVLGLALGRIGCYLNGCCYGSTCSLPWAVEFPYNSPPFVRQVEENKLDLQGLKFADLPNKVPVIDQVIPGSPADIAGLKPGDKVKAIGHRDANDTRPKMVTPVFTASDAKAALLQADTPDTVVTVQVDVDGVPRARTWTVTAPLPRSLPTHPTQLYSAIDAGLLCLFLLAWYPYRRRDGELMVWMLILHAVSRFLLESIRTDERAVFGTGMSISQNISIGMLAFGIGLWIYLLRQPRQVAFYAPAAT